MARLWPAALLDETNLSRSRCPGTTITQLNVRVSTVELLFVVFELDVPSDITVTV